MLDSPAPVRVGAPRVHPLPPSADPGVDQRAPRERPRQSRHGGDLPHLTALDGLRGLAVMAVILYHFVPWLMPGGFLGVDAFFVVSGFLIARLLVRDLGVHGNVRLGRFWGRRVRRLLPAALTTVFIVMCAALLLSSAVQLHDLRDQLIASVLYGANWMLIAGKTSYFATLQGPSPLIHMWSLAVEEQFYLVFPLVLVVCGRWLRSGWKLTAGVLVVGALASTALMAVLYHGGDPSRIYYGTDTHAMGLLLGAALGVMSLAPGLDGWGWPLRVTNVAALFAFAAVLFAMASTHQESAWLYQGGFLVFSALCCVVIWSVAHARTTGLARLLSVPVLVAIGLRSYALYLWHWPVRVFIDTDNTGLTGYQLTMLRVVVLVLLAEASYQLVERAFRTGKLFQRFGTRSTVIYAGTLTVAVILVATFVITAPLPPTNLADALKSSGHPAAAGAMQVDVFGDSTAYEFAYNGVLATKSLPGLSIGGSAGLGCSLVDGSQVSAGRVVEQPPECAGWQARWRDKLELKPTPVASVLMTGAWEILDHVADGSTVSFGTPAWTALVRHAVNDAIRTLGSAQAPVFVFDAPCYPNRNTILPLPERTDPRRIKAFNEILTQAADGHPNVHLVKFHALVCPRGRHLESVHGKDIWQGDGVHLNEAGAVFVWRWLLPQIKDVVASEQN
jgi:peptidoglycan/LPS O-acetylase OafA/YrhL